MFSNGRRSRTEQDGLEREPAVARARKSKVNESLIAEQIELSGIMLKCIRASRKELALVNRDTIQLIGHFSDLDVAAYPIRLICKCGRTVINL